MRNDLPRTTLEERIRSASSQVEDELRGVIRYLNDEVVPEVRRSGSAALRFASSELRSLAERIEDANRPGPHPPR